MLHGDGVSDSRPLLALTLFQSVNTYGANQDAFTFFSKDLKEFEDLHDAPDYDEERFTEESLKAVFLRVIREEVLLQILESCENGDNHQQIPSPKISTIADATSYLNLVPQLIDKLYLAYKEQAIQEIEEYGRQYFELTRDKEMKVVEAATSQDIVRQAPEEDQLNTQSKTEAELAQIGKTGEQLPAVPERASNNKPQIPLPTPIEPEGTSIRNPPSGITTKEDETLSSRSGNAEVKISSMLNPTTPDPRPPMRTSETNAALSFKDAQTSQSPTSRRAPSPLASAPQLPTVQPNTRRPIDGAHHSPYESLPPRTNLPPSPNLPQSSANNLQTTYVPPPAGMTRATGSETFTPIQPSSQGGQRTAPVPTAVRQLPSPNQVRRQSQPFPEPNRPQPEWSTPQAYPNHRQQPNSPPYNHQQSYPPNAAQRGGVMLPPFQVSPQTANDSNQNQLPRPSSGPVPPRPQAKQVIGMRSSQGLSGLRTPLSSSNQSTPLTQLRRKPGVSYSPLSSTGWKIRLPNPEGVPFESIARPTAEIESIESSKRSPSPNGPSQASTVRVKRSMKASKKDIETEETTPLARPSNARGSRAQGNATRAISKTPSTAPASLRGRTRSHSVASQADELAFATLPTTRKVKDEPSTPASRPDDIISVSRGGRRAAAPSNKRKRADSKAGIDLSEIVTPRPSHHDTILPSLSQPNTIIAFRNFQKMTVPIMNNITSHKHASLFALPVKDRDAEGYSDLIHTPQDLKSIRAAIVAGTRAVAAAIDGTINTPSNTPRANDNTTSTGTTVTLPWSPDLVPPRGIVNGAQLEMEIMRMFANAIMFNVGYEGVVKDTREMFESVDAGFAEWRATERNAAENQGLKEEVGMEVDELGEDEGNGGERAKRRRA